MEKETKILQAEITRARREVETVNTDLDEINADIVLINNDLIALKNSGEFYEFVIELTRANGGVEDLREKVNYAEIIYYPGIKFSTIYERAIAKLRVIMDNPTVTATGIECKIVCPDGQYQFTWQKRGTAGEYTNAVYIESLAIEFWETYGNIAINLLGSGYGTYPSPEADMTGNVNNMSAFDESSVPNSLYPYSNILFSTEEGLRVFVTVKIPKIRITEV